MEIAVGLMVGFALLVLWTYVAAKSGCMDEGMSAGDEQGWCRKTKNRK